MRNHNLTTPTTCPRSIRINLHHTPQWRYALLNLLRRVLPVKPPTRDLVLKQRAPNRTDAQPQMLCHIGYRSCLRVVSQILQPLRSPHRNWNALAELSSVNRRQTQLLEFPPDHLDRPVQLLRQLLNS